MKKTITIYELLGLIKDGKAPKKIATQGYTFELIENTDTIRDIYVDEDGDGLFSEYYWELDEEVEILPDEEDEFIDIEELDGSIGYINWNSEAVVLTNAINDLIKNQKKIIERLSNEVYSKH